MRELHISMIDPIHSLAFSMHSNPGVYALLIGSGVSRSAQILTGWEITLDLTRKLAEASGDSADPDTEAWYKEKFGEGPNYSKLLNALAKTPAERQQLLRPYFEPNDEEREEGAKQPTAAHRAIAQLVAKGFVRVIITTNVDPLFENSLEEEGVIADVLSTVDDVQNMRSLIHIRHCVLKVHGDYRDARIRNTNAELEEYPTEIDQLLDQIFSNFGLIVCGWSAEWDTALREALLRSLSRRYTTYWATHGMVGNAAQEVIRSCSAQEISIANADEFFLALQQQVESIDSSSRDHALTSDAAVDRLERFLSEPRYLIQLSKLISQSVASLAESISGDRFDMREPYPATESVTRRIRAYESECSVLLSMAAVGSRWAESDHWRFWQEALTRLASIQKTNGLGIWINLQLYPAALLLYTLGIGAVYSQKLDFLNFLFSTLVRQKNGDQWPVVEFLPRFALDGRDAKQFLAGMERRLAPLSDWLHETLRKHLANLSLDEEQYTMIFDEFEILLALGCGYSWSDRIRGYSAPLGAFMYRDNTKRIFQDILESIEQQREESPYVKSGIFGDSVAVCKKEVENLCGLVRKSGWNRFL